MEEPILQEDFQRTMQYLTETHKIAKNQGSIEQKDAKIYLQHCEKLCSIRNNYQVKKEAYMAAEQEQTLEAYDRVLETGLNTSPKKFNPKNVIEYKAFSASLTNDEENISKNDDLVMRGGINKFDPITKTKMVNPVRSSVCGHRYEKDTIIEQIKQLSKLKRKTKCPVSGCQNENMKLDELKDDPVFKAKLQNDDEEDHNL